MDECLPRKLKTLLPGHVVLTVPERGWAGIKDKPLLALMNTEFNVFVTVDGNLTYQQNLSGSHIALVVLSAPDNTFETLSPLMPQLLAALTSITPGQVVTVQSKP